MSTQQIHLAGEILILTGPPGSGKTTTSKKLAQLPGSSKVHLHTDDFWHYIKAGKVEPFLPEAHAQNGIVMNAIARVADEYAKGGYFVIVDGIIGPWFLEPFAQLTAPVHYVVLYPPLEEAIKRCEERSGQTLVDPGTIVALHQQFSSIGPLQKNLMCIRDFDKDSTLDAVMHGLQSRDFLLMK